jgi:hypothetical protein
MATWQSTYHVRLYITSTVEHGSVVAGAINVTVLNLVLAAHALI